MTVSGAILLTAVALTALGMLLAAWHSGQRAIAAVNLILLDLSQHGPSSSLDIGMRTGLGQGILYQSLRFLERRGRLSSWEDGLEHSERGGRPRRYYALKTAPA